MFSPQVQTRGSFIIALRSFDSSGKDNLSDYHEDPLAMGALGGDWGLYMETCALTRG